MAELAKTISVSIRPEMYKKINSFCSERGCSRSWFMNKAAERYLSECMEDMADYEAAVAAWKEFEESGERGIPAEEVFAKAGL